METSRRSERVTPFARLTSTVCRRAFSSPEALGYEALISPAVLDVVTPCIAIDDLGRPILDVGSGGGRLAAWLAERTAGVVVGVDPSAAQARRLARRHRRGSAAESVQASAQGLPFPDATFGSVVSSCAVKHWPDPALGVRECLRVLRPGGMLLVVEIDGDGTADEVRRFTTLTRVPRPLHEAYIRFALRTVVRVAPSAAELEALLRSPAVTGLRVEKVIGLPFLVVTATKR